MKWPLSTACTLPVSTSHTLIRMAWSAKTTRLPSGDQVMLYRNPGPMWVTCRSSPVPSAARRQSSYSPLRSLK